MVQGKIRINKFLSECGVASRRKSEEYIDQGRIAVNGNIILDLSVKIDPDKDEVTLDGEKIRPEKKVYFLLNKPKKVVTTTSDEKGRASVIDLINTKVAIFPVGRLDYETTGALLLTNDGEFANFMMHPRNKVIRSYRAVLDKELSKEDRERLQKGIQLDRKNSYFTSVDFFRRNFKDVVVTTSEGRNHFVKRMFDALGYRVVNLHRMSYGNFTIENIAPGKYVKVQEKEIKAIMNKSK